VQKHSKKAGDEFGHVSDVAMSGQGLPPAGVVAECSGVGGGACLGQPRNRVRVVVDLHLDLQVTAVGAHLNLVMPEEGLQVVLQFDGFPGRDWIGHRLNLAVPQSVADIP